MNQSFKQIDSRLVLIENDIVSLMVRMESAVRKIDDTHDALVTLLQVIRRAQIQDVRVKEKAAKLVQENNIKDAVKILVDESRRADLQIIKFANHQTGLNDINRDRHDKKVSKGVKTTSVG